VERRGTGRGEARGGPRACVRAYASWVGGEGLINGWMQSGTCPKTSRLHACTCSCQLTSPPPHPIPPTWLTRGLVGARKIAFLPWRAREGSMRLITSPAIRVLPLPWGCGCCDFGWGWWQQNLGRESVRIARAFIGRRSLTDLRASAHCQRLDDHAHIHPPAPSPQDPSPPLPPPPVSRVTSTFPCSALLMRSSW